MMRGGSLERLRAGASKGPRTPLSPLPRRASRTTRWRQGMVRAAGNAPACSCSRSKRLTFRLRPVKLPSALNLFSGHYFDRARSLPAHQVQLGKMKWSSIRVSRPVFRFGRPACISQHLCPDHGVPYWNRTSLCGFAGRRLSCSANGIRKNDRHWTTTPLRFPLRCERCDPCP